MDKDNNIIESDDVRYWVQGDSEDDENEYDNSENEDDEDEDEYDEEDDDEEEEDDDEEEEEPSTHIYPRASQKMKTF